jgi:hypothetical protein
MGEMSKTFALYGIIVDDLETAKAVTERALHVSMQLHESGYRGGDYYHLVQSDKEEFILQRNLHPVEQEWIEPDFTDAPFLLYIDNTNRPDEISSLLNVEPRVRLLRRSD